MTVRDLGYRAYEGARTPPSHNTWVMLRHGLRRVWGSWLVWTAGIIAIFPPVIACGVLWFVEQAAQAGAGRPNAPSAPLANEWLEMLLYVQMWCFLSVITLRAGAAVIAEDF